MSVFYFFDKLRAPFKTMKTHPLGWARAFLLLSGSLSGLLGIGGGIVNVPVLHRLLKMDIREATRLSFLFVFLSVSTALVVIFNQRKEDVYQIPPLYLAVMLMGTVCGTLLSERIKISSQNIRKLFCVILLVLGIFKFYKAFV